MVKYRVAGVVENKGGQMSRDGERGGWWELKHYRAAHSRAEQEKYEVLI